MRKRKPEDWTRVKCDWCGVIFARTKAKMKRSVQHFCCTECAQGATIAKGAAWREADRGLRY